MMRAKTCSGNEQCSRSHDRGDETPTADCVLRFRPLDTLQPITHTCSVTSCYASFMWYFKFAQLLRECLHMFDVSVLIGRSSVTTQGVSSCESLRESAMRAWKRTRDPKHVVNEYLSRLCLGDI